MDIERARYLVSPEGRAARASLPARIVSLNPTALATTLRKSFAPFEASALAEQISLWKKAESQVPNPRDWLFTTPGLEMMTHPAIAARRAERLSTVTSTVVDLTCGLGGDLSAAVETGASAFGLERDPVTALLAASNLPAASIVHGDATRAPFSLANAGVIVDPSRRDDRHERIFDPDAFSPPFDLAMDLARGGVIGVVKGPPGLSRDRVPADAEFEAVQYGRTLRETALWFGAGVEPGLRRAVYLPSGETLDSNDPECPPDAQPPGPVILDPQSCVTRAGLVRHLAARVGASMLDWQIAYITAADPLPSALAEPFEVLDTIPFSIDRLRKRLREGRWNPRDVRRRAFPVEPDELRRLLGKFEGTPVTLLCTTIAGDRTVFICQPLSTHAGTRPAI